MERRRSVPALQRHHDGATRSFHDVGLS
jgi:hypothetical protein